MARPCHETPLPQRPTGANCHYNPLAVLTRRPWCWNCYLKKCYLEIFFLIFFSFIKWSKTPKKRKKNVQWYVQITTSLRQLCIFIYKIYNVVDLFAFTSISQTGLFFPFYNSHLLCIPQTL